MHWFSKTVADYKAGASSEAELYRSIMAWPAWIAPAGPDDHGGDGIAIGVIADHRGWKVMELFSDAQTLAKFAEQDGVDAPERTVTLPGYQIFGTLADEAVQRINLDLYSEHATHFFEQQIPLLRAWAGVTEVELALAVPDRIPDPFAVLRRFDGFQVLMRGPETRRELVMAPDANDRLLAAVFTADDTIEAFVEAVSDDIEGALHIERLDGETLFGLLGRLPLDGIVFNPLGPVPAVALAAGVIERIVGAPSSD